MPSSSESNISLLLDPISNEKPCGESLRYSEVYDQIREARREDDENLPQGVWKTEIKKADWARVASLCQEALKDHTKDLQIAAWLTEAWLHLEGIGGLARGVELILGLSRTFWEDIHPQIKNASYELRLVPYEWMNIRLSEDCHSVLISVPADRAIPPSRLLDFHKAQRLELLSKKKPSQEHSQPSDSQQEPRHKVFLSIDQTPTAFYQYMDECCALALKRIVELEEELRLHLDEGAPTFYRLREKIEGVKRFANHILDNKHAKKEGKKVNIMKAPRQISPKQSVSGAIESREQAYALLGDVASYLERIEPHSPTPYLIRRAMSWGEMSLPQVLDTLTNNKDLSLFLDILNVEKNKKADETTVVNKR